MRLLVHAAFAFAAVKLVVQSWAQPGAVDVTFDAGSATDGTVYTMALQGDGKLIIGGDFTIADREVRGRIARLNADGTADKSFGAGVAGANSIVYAVALQDDGKIVIGGTFTNVNGSVRYGIARLESDGGLDTNFNTRITSFNRSVYSIALQADGKIVICGDFEGVNEVSRRHMARLNVDGSLDENFVPIVEPWSVRSVAMQSDGKILIVGDFTQVNGITCVHTARLHPDGSVDTSFNAVVDFDLPIFVTTLDGGKILIAGSFRRVNGVMIEKVARLHENGSLDTNFHPTLPVGYALWCARPQGDGKIIVGGQFEMAGGQGRNGIARLNADGSVDASFGSGLSGTAGGAFPFAGVVFCLAIQPDGKPVIGGEFTHVNGDQRRRVARLNTDGATDASFKTLRSGVGGPNPVVYAVASQADGKVIIGGEFNTVHGAPRSRIARLNGDGSLDTRFATGLAGADYSVLCLALQGDGKVLVGGNFTRMHGLERPCIARLHRDGSLDTTFATHVDGWPTFNVRALAWSTNGKAMIGGQFDTPRNHVARLNPSGASDIMFGHGLPGVGGVAVNAVATQNDGKVIIGGDFTTVNGVARRGIARLNADGSLDVSFGNGLSGAADRPVHAVAIQADGKVLIGGEFTTVNDMPRIGFARLNSDGSLDTNFVSDASGAWPVYAVLVQPGGAILIGGGFVSINGQPRRGIARLHADGSLDNVFGEGLSGVAGSVRSMAIQNDGRLWIGGEFRIVNDLARSHISRLHGDRPPLTINPVGLNVSLRWPVGWTGFVPETTPSLKGSWDDLGQLPVNDGTNWSVTVPAAPGGGFYRLRD